MQNSEQTINETGLRARQAGTHVLSVILPSYNEEGNIARTAETLGALFSDAAFDYELVFVDDGSSDRTRSEIERAKARNPKIKGICFSRNFGKEAAIYAGLRYASGDAAVVMDCDLQHPPETILKMYALWLQGYDVVEGVKTSRGRENPLHALCAGLFYRLISAATGIDMENASDFKLMDRQVVEALLSMPERHSFFRALSAWVGFSSVSIGFEVQERQSGSSKWSARALIRYAVTNLTSFTAFPLQLVSFGGLVMFLFALFLGAETLIRYFSGCAVEGFTTVILLLLLIGSAIMLSLGVIGHYIAKIYDEVKKRPKYIVSEIF